MPKTNYMLRGRVYFECIYWLGIVFESSQMSKRVWREEGGESKLDCSGKLFFFDSRLELLCFRPFKIFPFGENYTFSF